MLDGTQIIVPEGAIKLTLRELHRAHSGADKMYRTATQLYYWPGMKNCIYQTVDRCSAYMEDRPTQARTPASISPPSQAKEPMKHVGTDIFDALGNSKLVLVDSTRAMHGRGS